MKQTVLWMTGAICSFSLMALAGRELSGQINTFEMLFFRSLLGLIVISTVIACTRKIQYFQSAQIKGHLIRNSFHFLGQYGWFIGLGILPLAQVFAIEFTVPFWTAIIASVFLKDRLTLTKVSAIVIAFVGVLLIVQPSLEHFDNASLIVLGAAICYACAHTGTKVLAKNNHPLTILFYMCLIQLPIGGVMMIPHWTNPTLLQWGWILIIALTALTAHFCMTKAMLTSTVTTVVTLDFMRLPLIAVVGFFLYQEAFGLWAIIGACIILGAMFLSLKLP
ncbi:DMT family transporter [Psychromonas sp. Urea-02u-13]|uniref:DMT family transporter n=1 Tax=Psychromonas sp. Urea-02u-13 TaxID=2058326 RepID=UPI0018E2B6A4|nr:DMT family transporter [Psychromonas sp. Urea-02u-13]